MLKSLVIRDIVLIERLELDFASGLSVLTGETGAGKSIILDALGLALGGRGDRGLVRAGADAGLGRCRVRAAVCRRCGLCSTRTQSPFEGELILRRLVTADGRSRAFVNDTPVSGGLLRQVGDMLVEVHGQFDQRGLLNPQVHRSLLDAFGGLATPVAAVRAAHAAWRAGARRSVDELRERLAAARREEDYLRHRERELADLAPEPGRGGGAGPAPAGADEPREDRRPRWARRWPPWAAKAAPSRGWAPPSAAWSAAPMRRPSCWNPPSRPWAGR